MIFFNSFIAMEIRYIGGVFGGNIRPTPFLCLTLKMLQIQPEKDIVVEFIKNEEFKYVRALGAFYLRLTGTSTDCYKYLEPLYNDNRKLRNQNRNGQYEIIHMDEYIDELLRSDRVCDIILPRVQKRHILEENNELEPKVSALDDDLDEEASDDDHNPVEEAIKQELYDTTRKKINRKERERSTERNDRDRLPERRRGDRDRRHERDLDERNDRDRSGRREKDRYVRPNERDDRDRTRYRDHGQKFESDSKKYERRDKERERGDRKHNYDYDDRDRRRH